LLSKLFEQRGILEREKHEHFGHWFRGHADATWKLEPKLYRAKDFNGEETLIDKVLREERLSVQDFRAVSASIRIGTERDDELYFLRQHYGIPTRLLDWTTNPLVALFFACQKPTGSESQTDGKLFYLQAYKLVEKKTHKDTRLFGVADSRHPCFSAWMKHIFDWRDWDDSEFWNKLDLQPAPPLKFTFPVRPAHFDRRITLQQGCFTFHAPEEKILEEVSTIQVITIEAIMKQEILKRLEALNINDFTIYGDMDALGRYLSRVYS
jgi:hypothetical protein